MDATFDAWSRRAARRRGRAGGARMKAPLRPRASRSLLGAISGTVLFVMMMVTAVDVAGRYLFSKPLAGGFELTEMMLAALIYCGLPLVSKRREHIVIDTFDPFMSKRVKRGLDILADIVCTRRARRPRAGCSFAAPSASPSTATRPAC